MLFVWMGFLKAGAGPVPQAVQQQTSDFLQQPYIKIHSVGPLRDEAGERVAMMMVFEVENRTAAQALVDNSPYLGAGLYERHHLFEYANEAG
jgi:uncharacterized protein YciI